MCVKRINAALRARPRPRGSSARALTDASGRPAGASVRAALRSLAERARGLAAVSVGLGTVGPFVVARKVGSAAGAAGRCREPPGRRPLRAAMNCLTMRSSSEWKVTTASRPPGLSTRSAACSARANSPSSSLTAMRSAWKTRVAGCRPPGSARTSPATRSASCARGLDAALAAFFDDGAGDGPGPPLLAVMKEDVGQLRLGGLVDEVGGAPPVPLHAHVERPVAAEREAALGLVELHRRHADVENDAVDALEAGSRGDRVERAEAAGHENEPALRGRRERGAGRHGVGIAIDGDHAVGGVGVEKGRRIAAGPEGAVDEDAAARDLQRLADLRQEHGHVTGQSASGAGRAVAATRHRSRAPGGLFCTRPPGREPRTFFRSRTFARASSRCVRKRSGSHIWNL